MSTVLWANYLKDGRVTSEESDRYALYKHSKKLDRLTQKLGVTSFIAAQDTTDAEFNVSEQELPEGVESTDEVMVKSGTWIEARAAVTMLEALVSEIRSKDIRFGLLSNAQEEVIGELEESLRFAKEAASQAAKFNFAVVM